jgi:hypothetical protein
MRQNGLQKCTKRKVTFAPPPTVARTAKGEPLEAIDRLRDRVLEAASKYPDNGRDTPALASANLVLRRA